MQRTVHACPPRARSPVCVCLRAPAGHRCSRVEHAHTGVQRTNTGVVRARQDGAGERVPRHRPRVGTRLGSEGRERDRAGRDGLRRHDHRRRVGPRGRRRHRLDRRAPRATVPHRGGRLARRDEPDGDPRVRTTGRAALRPVEGRGEPDEPGICGERRVSAARPADRTRRRVRLRHGRHAGTDRSGDVRVLPVHDAGGGGGARVRRRTPPLQATRPADPCRRGSCPSRRGLRRTGPAAARDPARPTAAARLAPADAAARRSVGAARSDAQAPRGPARRGAVRVDGVVLGATRRRARADPGR